MNAEQAEQAEQIAKEVAKILFDTTGIENWHQVKDGRIDEINMFLNENINNYLLISKIIRSCNDQTPPQINKQNITSDEYGNHFEENTGEDEVDIKQLEQYKKEFVKNIIGIIKNYDPENAKRTAEEREKKSKMLFDSEEKRVQDRKIKKELSPGALTDVTDWLISYPHHFYDTLHSCETSDDQHKEINDIKGSQRGAELHKTLDSIKNDVLQQAAKTISLEKSLGPICGLFGGFRNSSKLSKFTKELDPDDKQTFYSALAKENKLQELKTQNPIRFNKVIKDMANTCSPDLLSHTEIMKKFSEKLDQEDKETFKIALEERGFPLEQNENTSETPTMRT